MSRITTVTISLAALLSLIACDDSTDYPGQYQNLIDKACACKDTACYDSVSDTRRVMRAKFRNEYRDKKEEGKAIAKKLEKLDDAWRKCVTPDKTSKGQDFDDKVMAEKLRLEKEFAEYARAREEATKAVAAAEKALAEAKTEDEHKAAQEALEKAQAKLAELRAKRRKGKRPNKPDK